MVYYTTALVLPFKRQLKYSSSFLSWLSHWNPPTSEKEVHVENGFNTLIESKQKRI